METTSAKKSGIVAVVGRSNVGKSTLMNALVGSKIAITSPTPQTTRHVIHGVLHDPRGQAVLADTPGIFATAPDLLTTKLNEKAKDALSGIDVVLYVVDPTRHVGEEEKAVRRLVANAKVPVILTLNKRDLDRPYMDEYLSWGEDIAVTVEVSAKAGLGLEELRDAIFAHLPEGEPLYPEGQLTNLDDKLWFAELIREKLFLSLHQEVPYTVHVEVDEIARRDNGVLYVHATIVTTDARYRKMLIGHGGQTVKKIGQSVRKELELIGGGKVFVDLDVEIDKRWQERFE